MGPSLSDSLSPVNLIFPGKCQWEISSRLLSVIHPGLNDIRRYFFPGKESFYTFAGT